MTESPGSKVAKSCNILYAVDGLTYSALYLVYEFGLALPLVLPLQPLEFLHQLGIRVFHRRRHSRTNTLVDRNYLVT